MSRSIGIPPFSFYFYRFISPDGKWVVYRADQDTDEVIEIYSVPIGGGTVTKLNDTLVAGGETGFLHTTPDSTTVVYYADQDQKELCHAADSCAYPVGRS